MFETVSASAVPTDEALVDLAKRGDAAAREELFRRQFDAAYRVARLNLGHAEDALDAVQDAFAKALQGLERYRGGGSFSTWLLRIVQNSARDIGRARGRWARRGIHSLPGSEQGPAIIEDQSRGIDQVELRSALDCALSQLTPTLRETFVLFAETGLTYDEIALLQAIPIGTVMSRIHSARKKLQPLLEKLNEN